MVITIAGENKKEGSELRGALPSDAARPGHAAQHPSDSLQIDSHSRSIVCTNIIAECAATTALVCSPVSTCCQLPLGVMVLMDIV